jgi:hypothetical protein
LPTNWSQENGLSQMWTPLWNMVCDYYGASLLSAVWWWLLIRWHILSNDIGVVLGYWLMQSLLLGFDKCVNLHCVD